MSNIIKSKDIIILLNNILKEINKPDISKEELEMILEILIPKDGDKQLVEYQFKENLPFTTRFNPSKNTIILDKDNINIWLNTNHNDLTKNIDNVNINQLTKLLLIYMLSHQIELSYQYLMSKDIVECQDETLRQAYKGLMEILVKDKNNSPLKESKRLLHLLLYKDGESSYLLKRNANIESIDLICKLCLEMDDIKIYDIFNRLRYLYLQCGYCDSCIGSIEETYRKLLMYKKYKEFYKESNLSTDEKIRLGLRISEEERKQLLKK